jgi:exosortase
MTLHSRTIRSADIAFFSCVGASIIAFWKPLFALVVFSLNHEYCSHIILIPAISVALLYMNRGFIRKTFHPSAFGLLLLLPAVPVLVWVISRKASLNENDFLAGTTFAVVCVWISGFAVCYGVRAFRAAIFPLFVLFLMVPLPTVVLEATIHGLQQGSTQITYWLLQAVGQPSLKDGFTIMLPTLTIFVAEECSGIRSSVALFITCLLAGHMMLKSNWRRALFVLLAFPVALVKNGIRIATLVLLSIHVDMRFMTSSLHRDGGFVFFFIALLIMYPILKLLQRSEAGKDPALAKTLAPAK